MDENLDLKKLEYLIVAEKSNETEDWSQKDTNMPDLITLSISTTIRTTSTISRKNLFGNSTDSSENEFQLYLIGVYGFFITLLAIGLIMVIARKLREACCTTNSDDDELDCETSLRRESLNSQDNFGFEHRVNVDSLDVEVVYQDHDSDYDYYSDASTAETNSLKDKPPAYEEPPSYLVASQK